MATLDLGTDLQIAGALLGDASPVASAVLGDLAGLASGQSVTFGPKTTKIGKFNATITGSAKLSKAQDVQNPNVLTILGDLLTDGTALVAGQTATLPTFTEKLGTSWLDETFTITLQPAT